MEQSEQLLMLLLVAVVAMFAAAIIRWVFRWVASLFSSAEIAVDKQARFQAAKAVIEEVHVDPITGEGYSHKITRVPAELPQSAHPAKIIEPIQRKAVRS